MEARTAGGIGIDNTTITKGVVAANSQPHSLYQTQWREFIDNYTLFLRL